MAQQAGNELDERGTYELEWEGGKGRGRPKQSARNETQNRHQQAATATKLERQTDRQTDRYGQSQTANERNEQCDRQADKTDRTTNKWTAEKFK